MRTPVQSKGSEIRSISDQELVLAESDLEKITGGVTLSYDRVDFVYKPQDDTGTAQGTVATSSSKH